jgi:hypothetical protein
MAQKGVNVFRRQDTGKGKVQILQMFLTGVSQQMFEHHYRFDFY